MPNYSYVAVDPHGSEKSGVLDVASQREALRRIHEMGLFPTNIKAASRGVFYRTARKLSAKGVPEYGRILLSRRRRVKTGKLVVFTRQLATMIGAGVSLLRSLRILEEQEEDRRLRGVITDISLLIENGSSLSEAIASHPRVFSALYLNLIKAGESAGALESTLSRLAEFMERAQAIKRKLKAALIYPCAVLVVAGVVTGLLMLVIVPRFEQVFQGLLEGAALPAFTRFIFGLSGIVVRQFPLVLLAGVSLMVMFLLSLRTRLGRRCFDRIKLSVPLVGPLFKKAAISRFARTFGTLAGSGVPILQALTIVEGAAGNLVVGEVIARVREQVKQGEPIAPCLKASGVFPAMVAGLVDVGEQTGALPELLMKVADNYEQEFDAAASALTSLLEPVLILILAVIVGSIVVAMFLPLIALADGLEVPAARL